MSISLGNGKGKMELSKLQGMRKHSQWNNLFPIEFDKVLHVLRAVVSKTYDLGLGLGAPIEFLETLQVNFPSDVDRRRREVVQWWMSSSLDSPCWWKLVEVLNDIEMSTLAQAIREEHGESSLTDLVLHVFHYYHS